MFDRFVVNLEVGLGRQYRPAFEGAVEGAGFGKGHPGGNFGQGQVGLGEVLDDLFTTQGLRILLCKIDSGSHFRLPMNGACHARCSCQRPHQFETA